MATIREVLQFVIEGDPKGAIKAFDDVEKASKDSLAKSETRLDKWGGALTKGGAAAVGFAAVAGVGLYKTAQNAEELDRNMARVAGNFGEGAPKVKRFIEEANKIGLSDRAASGFVATLGELATGMGVTEEAAADLVPQVVDVVAQLGFIKGMKVEDALGAVQSAMIGEYDALQRLVPQVTAAGIEQKALAESGKATAAELTAAEKSTAALHLVLESGQQTLARSGDAMDGMAGKTAEAKANLDDAVTTIGEGVIPIAATATGFIADLAGAFNKMPEPAQRAAGTVAGVVTALGLAGGAASVAVGQIIKMRGTFTTVNDAGGRSLSTLGKVGAAAGVAAIGVGLGVAIYNELGREAREAADRVDELTGAVKASGDTLGEEFTRRFADWISENKDVQSALDDTGTSAAELTEVVQGSDKAWRDFSDAQRDAVAMAREGKTFEDLGRTNAFVAGQIDSVVDKMDEQRAAFTGSREALKTYNEVAEGVKNVQGDVTTSTDALTDETEKATPAVKDLKDTTDELAEAFKISDEAVKLWGGNLNAAAQGADAFGESLGGASGPIANAAAMGETFDSFKESVGKLPKEIDTAKLALGGYDDTQEDAIGTLTDATAANADYLSTLIESGQTLPDVTGKVDALRGEYVRQMEAAGLTTGQIDEYLRVLGLTPEQVETAIKLAGDAEARFKLELLQGQIDKLDQGAQAEITQKIIEGDWQGAMEVVTRESQKYADRHPIKVPIEGYGFGRGIPPELRVGPNPGALVTPTAGPAAAAMGVSPMTAAAVAPVSFGHRPIVVNVNLPAGSEGREVVAALRRYERKNGSRNAGWQPI